MPCLVMPPGTRELLRWMAERDVRKRTMLGRRIAYGGKKGRAATRRLKRMGPSGLWDNTERLIASIYGPEYARPPYGFARENDDR